MKILAGSKSILESALSVTGNLKLNIFFIDYNYVKLYFWKVCTLSDEQKYEQKAVFCLPDFLVQSTQERNIAGTKKMQKSYIRSRSNFDPSKSFL